MPDTIHIVSFENQEFKFDFKFNVIFRTVCSCKNRLFILSQNWWNCNLVFLGSLMEGCSVRQAKYIFSLVLRSLSFRWIFHSGWIRLITDLYQTFDGIEMAKQMNSENALGRLENYFCRGPSSEEKYPDINIWKREAVLENE